MRILKKGCHDPLVKVPVDVGANRDGNLLLYLLTKAGSIEEEVTLGLGVGGYGGVCQVREESLGRNSTSQVKSEAAGVLS